MAKTSPRSSTGKPAKAAATQVATVSEKTSQVFANKPFMRFVKHFGASHDDLLAMIAEVPDAELGGGVSSSVLLGKVRVRAAEPARSLR